MYTRSGKSTFLADLFFWLDNIIHIALDYRFTTAFKIVKLLCIGRTDLENTCLTNPIKFTHTLAFTILVWWLDHKWSGPLLLRWNLLTLFPGSDVIVFLSSGLYTWSRWKAPSSRLIAVAPFFLIWIASLMRLVNGLESLSRDLCPGYLPLPNLRHDSVVLCGQWRRILILLRR